MTCVEIFDTITFKIDQIFRFINVIKYGCGHPNFNGPPHLSLPFWHSYYHQRYIFYNSN